jgi:hypothetical protein
MVGSDPGKRAGKLAQIIAAMAAVPLRFTQTSLNARAETGSDMRPGSTQCYQMQRLGIPLLAACNLAAMRKAARHDATAGLYQRAKRPPTRCALAARQLGCIFLASRARDQVA